MKKILAALAASAAIAGASISASAPRAEAAIWGCSTGNETKSDAFGNVSYRSYAICYGTPPKGIKYYRIKAIPSILGTGVGDMAPLYGPYVKAASGKKSRTQWVAWPYWANREGRAVQTKK